MATGRDDFVIAFRSAFLKKKDKQKFSLLTLLFLSIFVIILSNLNFKVIKFIKMGINEFVYRTSFLISAPENKIKKIDTKIKDPRKASKGKKVSKIIRSFLKIKCPINDAAKELNKFFKKNKINLVVDQKYFPISSNKVSKLNVMFSTSFGRQLEYYTGMVFKIDIKSNSKIVNYVNGGRYDGLISDLGSQKKIPAVGAAFNL